MELPEAIIQLAQIRTKEKINMISNEMVYPINKAFAGVISPLFYQALEANPTLKEISLPINENIKEFFGGKSIDRELFLRMSILLNKRDLMKKWRKENQISKENAINNLMIFIQHNGQIEDMEEEIEFISKHLDEMENMKEFEMIPSEYLSEIFRKAKGINSEEKIYNFILKRLKEEGGKKNREKLIECIELGGLNNKYIKELIENINFEDLSELLFSKIQDKILSSERIQDRNELSSPYQHLQEIQVKPTEIQKEQKEKEKKNEHQRNDKEEEEEKEFISKEKQIVLLENFNQEYNTQFGSQYHNKKFSPLHYAAKINSKLIGEILISEGAYIETTDNNTVFNYKISYVIKAIILPKSDSTSYCSRE